MRAYLLTYTLLLFCFSAARITAQPKTVGLTKHFNGGDESGYVIFSPMNSDTIYAINKCGKKVHTWYSEYPCGYSFYLLSDGTLLKSGTYTDTSFGVAGGRGGIIEKLDWNSNVLWRYKIFNDSLCQHHDIKPMPNGNILVLTWHSISKQAAVALGRDSLNFGPGENDLWGERLIELKPVNKDSAEIVWQWDLFDHVIQNVDPLKPTYGFPFQHPELVNINYGDNLKTHDWIHANAIDYNEDLDQVMISSHNTSEIWIIDHSTTIAEAKSHSGGKHGQGGDLMYRWGNPLAYGQGTKFDQKLFNQHNAHWIEHGLKDSGSILLFNNGLDRDTMYSTVEVIKPPLTPNGGYFFSSPYGPASSSWIYKDSVPTRFFSPVISGAERLPNGNTLVCNGVSGKLFEVTQQKKVVWEYVNPTNAGVTLSDGQTSYGLQVFRAKFYSASYDAFTNRTLTPQGTIERSSYVYSCNYETVPPAIVSFSPKRNDSFVNVGTKLVMTFSETVLKRAVGGNIKIYQNKALLETINILGDSVVINKEKVTINKRIQFNLNSKIAVSVAIAFKDSSNNLSRAVDTSQWFFYTFKPNLELKLQSVSPAHLSANVPLNAKLQIVFKDNAFKSKAGNIVITENGTQKEVIPVQNANVAVSGNTVTITPSQPFKSDAQIKVSVDTCFKDSKGGYNKVIQSNAWSFRTISPPKIISLSPANSQVEVSPNANFVATFDKDIALGTSGNVMIYENGFLRAFIPFDDTDLSIQGRSVVINPVPNLLAGARISIAIRQNIVHDSNGLYFQGMDSSEWAFYVKRDQGSSVSKISNGIACSVYPNPGHGQFTLEAGVGITQVEVFDHLGRRVRFTPVFNGDKSVDILLENAASGLYSIRINGAYVMQVLVE